MNNNREDRRQDMQNQLAQAWITRDRSIMNGSFAPEWMVTHIDGRMSSKEEVLRDYDAGANRLLEGQVNNIKVQLFDGFAIVNGRTHARGEYSGHPCDLTLRVTDVFVRRNQQWHAVASHASRVSSSENTASKQ